MRRGWWLSAAIAVLFGTFLANVSGQTPASAVSQEKNVVPPPTKIEEPKKKETKKVAPKTVEVPPLPGTLPPALVVPALPKGPVEHPYKRLEGATVVFVINDAGSDDHLSTGFGEAMEGAGRVAGKTINWCRTPFETKKDWRDVRAQGSSAARIAMDVAILRKEAPHCRIIFVGHGVGGHVALIAAEMCAPKSIDRIILLGVSVSHRYCLEPALAASRGGIDNLWSNLDGTLDAIASDIGTSDGDRSGTTAGQYGFRIPKGAKGCENLRQISWGDQMRFHHGGHYGWTNARFMSDWVVPLVLNDAPPAPVLVPIPAPKIIDAPIKK